MRFYTKPRRNPMVNIVSLIDILCIVLIFFIVTTTFKRDEPMIKLELPESHTAKRGQENIPTIITVSKTGIVYLESTPVAVETLTGLLRQKKAASDGAKFALRASKDSPFGVIVKVMDAVRDAGLETLPTFTEETSLSAPP